MFTTRFDNLIAVTNGVSLESHDSIQKEINQNFPVTVSMGVGSAISPYQAQVQATLSLQRVGSSRSAKRKGALMGSCVRKPDKDWVQIAHMDINHSTLITDSEPIYNTHLLFQRAHISLMSSLLKRDALVFYMGGDNLIALSNGLGGTEINAVLSELKAEHGLEMKAGVGAAHTADRAAYLASEGLHEIRKGGNKSPIVVKTA